MYNQFYLKISKKLIESPADSTNYEFQLITSTHFFNLINTFTNNQFHSITSHILDTKKNQIPNSISQRPTTNLKTSPPNAKRTFPNSKTEAKPSSAENRDFPTRAHSLRRKANHRTKSTHRTTSQQTKRRQNCAHLTTTADQRATNLTERCACA